MRATERVLFRVQTRGWIDVLHALLHLGRIVFKVTQCLHRFRPVNLTLKCKL